MGTTKKNENINIGELETEVEFNNQENNVVEDNTYYVKNYVDSDAINHNIDKSKEEILKLISSGIGIDSVENQSVKKLINLKFDEIKGNVQQHVEDVQNNQVRILNKLRENAESIEKAHEVTDRIIKTNAQRMSDDHVILSKQIKESSITMESHHEDIGNAIIHNKNLIENGCEQIRKSIDEAGISDTKEHDAIVNAIAASRGISNLENEDNKKTILGNRKIAQEERKIIANNLNANINEYR